MSRGLDHERSGSCEGVQLLFGDSKELLMDAF